MRRADGVVAADGRMAERLPLLDRRGRLVTDLGAPGYGVNAGAEPAARLRPGHRPPAVRRGGGGARCCGRRADRETTAGLAGVGPASALPHGGRVIDRRGPRDAAGPPSAARPVASATPAVGCST
jgi:hypothetical protein